MSIAFQILFWLISFTLTVGILFINIMFLILCKDLEQDYVNPIEFTENLNKLVVPEYSAEGLLCAVLLVGGHWIVGLTLAPLVYLNVKRWMQHRHVFESTSAFNVLPLARRQSQVKLGCFALLFFYLLYSFVYFIVHFSTKGSQHSADFPLDIAEGTTV
jgi:hypothetical protein